MGHGKDRMVRVEKDVTYCGMTFDAWRTAAQKAGRRFQLFEDLEETIMREYRDTERFRAAERQAKGVAETPGHLGLPVVFRLVHVTDLMPSMCPTSFPVGPQDMPSWRYPPYPFFTLFTFEYSFLISSGCSCECVFGSTG